MQLVRPARNVPLALQVAGQLKALIASGAWPVGEKIPGELELSNQLGISRNSVREALRSLVHAGLLEARPGDGTYVRAASELGVTLHRRVGAGDAEEAYEVRSMLEQGGAALAAQRATAEQLSALHEVLRRRDAARDQGDEAAYVAEDLAFHRGVVEAGGNSLLAELYAHLHDAVTAGIARTLDADTRSSLDPRHHELLGAIERRQPAEAQEIAAALVEESRQLGRRLQEQA
ncbi:FadR/GntR family transcriptional regulator [Arthrobacter mobilis]|uniref:FadR family transcriptional regulator n=1 Tax=Arthrobacter mobilis TaxID=2724944 RepID=A0A7X6H9L2_9MICC|nr:FCD domain-containing protein [Arthrobacter mobilis]NKX52992.1 FadR family transcriptional regulator [Arthrobacter mobilis]